MLTVALLALLCASCSAKAIQARSSYSGEYGGVGGQEFSHSGNQLDGPITAFRVRADGYHIVGLQVRYGRKWSTYEGGTQGDMQDISLNPGELVIQVFGKYDCFLTKLVFLTNQGRYLYFGNDQGKSFSAAPLYPNSALSFISGRSGALIDAIGLHWDACCEPRSSQ